MKRARLRMEEIVYDTNELIDFMKKGKLDLTVFTTVFNVVEFPKALEFEQLEVIYPNIEDYEESVELSLALLENAKPLPAIDILAAAMCLRRNFVLATLDNHFSAIGSIYKNFKLKLAKQ